MKAQFIKIFDKCCGHYDRWRVFSDWTTMCAISIYNAIHKNDEAEKQYLELAKAYTKDQLSNFAELLAITTNELERDPRDFLGEIFGELDVYNSKNGQFFTPFSLSMITAGITAKDCVRFKGKVIKVDEPSVGAGGMLIAFWNCTKNEDKEYTHMRGSDIDYRCFCMSYIQLSLLGISAEIRLGNTLSNVYTKSWLTPCYYLYNMALKLALSDTINLDQDEPMAIKNTRTFYTPQKIEEQLSFL